MAKLTAEGPYGRCHLCGENKTVYSLFVSKLDGEEIPLKSNGSEPMWQVCPECARSGRLVYSRK